MDQVIGLILLIIFSVAVFFDYKWVSYLSFRFLQSTTKYKSNFHVGMNHSMSHGFGFLVILVSIFPLLRILRFFSGIGDVDWPLDEMKVVFIVFIYMGSVSFIVFYRYLHQLIKGPPKM